jgi:hypothetical protein
MKHVKSQKIVDGPRTSSSEAKMIMEGIPALNGLFTRTAEEKARAKELGQNLDTLEGEDGMGDTTDGLMYFSRLGKGAFLGRMRELSDNSKRNESALKRSKSKSIDDDDAYSVGSMESRQKEKEDAKEEMEGLELGGVMSTADPKSASSVYSVEASAKILKRRKIALSLATLASRPDRIKDIINDGAIAAVIELAAIPDIVIQKSCSATFALLARRQENRKRMHDEGAVQAILSLVSAPNAMVKIESAKALVNLMCEETDGNQYETRAVKDGLPYSLVRMVPECPQAFDLSLQCLLNLTCVEDRYTRIEEVTDAILHLENKMSLSDGQQLMIIKGLTNLSALRTFQQKLLEDGCMSVVESAMRLGGEELRTYAATIVRNLTTCYRTRPKLLDHNIVSLLMSMSKDPVEVVKSLAVKAMYLLSRDGSCRERIVAGNAVAVILKISQDSSNIAIGRLAAKTLRVLCGDASVAHTLVGDGIVKVLMTLLKNDDNNIRQYCAESICSLFQINTIIVRLIDQGAVGVIVSLSKNPSCTAITREWCSFALYYLCTSRACNEDTLEAGIIPCLIELCQDNLYAVASSKTKYFCSASFAYVTLMKDIDSSGAIPVMLHMLEHEEDVLTKNNCISSLYNLADLDENCVIMLDNNCMMPILHLAQSENQDTRIKCAAILCRLSLQEAYYGEFLESRVMEILLELSSLEHTLTQRRVIIAMSNLSSNPDLRSQLLSLKPIPYIISLASKRDENLRRGCVSIVCNLTVKRGTEREIVDAGIVPTLLITAMISSDQIETKIICCKALINLMADPEMYPQMVKDGAIWGFSNLATQDPYLLQVCSKALACLSYDFAGPMLESSSTVKTAIHLVNQTNDQDLQRCGGTILLNLLQHKDSEVPAFRKYVVSNMRPLAESHDEECNEMAVHILSKLSNWTDCTEQIVSSGMLQLIDAGSIFNKKKLAVAYLTMFGNISNDQSMRIKVLNDRTVEKFKQICMNDDKSTDLIVVKTVYALSCSKENIPRLANTGALGLMELVWGQEYKKDEEFAYYVLAILFNMTTCEEAQGTLVSKGIVELIRDMWEEFKSVENLCLMACQAIVHLCCGQINTSKAVTEGAGTILVYVTDTKKTTAGGFKFSYDMHYRVSAAMRNILCVPVNHIPMVQCGCVHALENIAALSEKGKNAHDPITPLTQANCLAAFKSMTYNSDVRDALKNSGAIDVIVQELLNEDTAIDYHLLVQVEAESWSNGARSTIRDGRAKNITPYPIDTSLISTFSPPSSEDTTASDSPRKGGAGTTNASKGLPRTQSSYNMERSYQSEIVKRDVKVELDEPELEIEESKEELIYGVGDLQSIDDPEDVSNPVLKLCPKMECDVDSVSVSYLKTDEVENYEIVDSANFFNNDLLASFSRDSLGDGAESKALTSRSTRSNKSRDGEGPTPRGGRLPGIMGGSSRPESKEAKRSARQGLLESIEQEQREEQVLPSLDANSSVSWGHGESKELNANTGAMTRTGTGNGPRKGGKPRATPEEKFDKLVGFIKASKQAQGAIPIGDVVDQWCKISRF